MLQVDVEPSLPAQVCTRCASAAKQAAPFVLLCQASDRKWQDITEFLTECTNEFKQTTIVYIGHEEMRTFSDYKPCKTKKRALSLMKAKTQGKVLREKSLCDAQCPECKERFRTVFSLNFHLRELRQVMCGSCKKIMPIESYTQHAKRHGVIAYMCKGCIKIFHCKSMFLRHHELCKYKGSHVCSECKRRFPSEFNLIAHVANNHTKKTCAACGVKFNRLCFKHHLKNCADSKPLRGLFICDYCSKEYSFKNALKLHIRFTHLIGWQYQCDQCGKKFSNPAHLREHDNTHNRVDDRYICSVCGSKYSTRRGYERHYKRHFNSEGELTDEAPRKKRTNKKLYMCVVCTFTSEYKRTLAKHLKAKHDITEWDRKVAF